MTYATNATDAGAGAESRVMVDRWIDMWRNEWHIGASSRVGELTIGIGHLDTGQSAGHGHGQDKGRTWAGHGQGTLIEGGEFLPQSLPLVYAGSVITLEYHRYYVVH